MKGSEIAANLREHQGQWTQYKYYEDGRYCVIGLKLHEAGVPVESWPNQEEQIQNLAMFQGLGLDNEQLRSLRSLQEFNDESDEVDDLIALLDDEPWKDHDFPIEALAAALKKQK